MPTNLNPYIQQLSWEEAREMILKVNPAFVEQVDKVDVPTSWQIFKVRYRYGDYLMKDGVVHLPNKDGQFAPLGDKSLPNEVNKGLAYAPGMPMGLSLNKAIEVFFNLQGRVVPLVLTEPGYLFSLGAALNPNSSFDKGKFWNLTAGVRSVYSVPKISCKAKHGRLERALGISLKRPTALSDHWENFRQIAQQSGRVNWELEVLYFSGDWFKKRECMDYYVFMEYLREYHASHSAFRRGIFFRNCFLSQIEDRVNMRLNPNNVNHIRHLISIGAGHMPGFSFAKDETRFPFKAMEEIYAEDYELKYAPAFLALDYNGAINKYPVYYSLQVPTTLEYYKETNVFKSISEEMSDLQHIVKSLQLTTKEEFETAANDNFGILKGLHSVDFHYYHTTDYPHFNIDQSTVIREADTNISSIAESNEKPFCYSTRIFRGLIGLDAKR